MLKLRSALIATAILAVSHAAVAQTSEPLVVTSSAPATPNYVITPSFPAGVVVPDAGITVTATGTVRVDGSFVLHSIRAPDGYAPLAAAVAEVIGMWRYAPALNRELCAPAETEIQQAVLFEGTADAPHISVGRFKRPEPHIPGGPTRVKSVQQPGYTFPEDAYRDGIEGRVVALFVVQPSGEVTAPKVWSSSPPGVFDLAVLDQIGKMRIVWEEPAPKRALCTQQTIDFCVVGGKAEHPYPGCHGGALPSAPAPFR